MKGKKKYFRNRCDNPYITEHIQIVKLLGLLCTKILLDLCKSKNNNVSPPVIVLITLFDSMLKILEIISKYSVQYMKPITFLKN